MISTPIIGCFGLECAYGLQDGGRSRAKEGGSDGPKPFEKGWSLGFKLGILLLGLSQLCPTRKEKKAV